MTLLCKHIALLMCPRSLIVGASYAREPFVNVSVTTCCRSELCSRAVLLICETLYNLTALLHKVHHLCVESQRLPKQEGYLEIQQFLYTIIVYTIFE